MILSVAEEKYDDKFLKINSYLITKCDINVICV